MIVARWLVFGSLIGALCGIASALFLMLLDAATSFRTQHDVIVFALPLAGLLLGWVSERFSGGNNLVLDTVHDGGAQLPPQLAPFVLGGTLVTHLFGGSAGREGTAVQMGATFADAISHRLRADPMLRRDLLIAGIAGGFGSVFGTPLAGLVFGLEVATPGRIAWRAFVPAAVASIAGDLTTRAFGIAHTPAPKVSSLPLDVSVVAKWLLFSVAIAATTFVFIVLVKAIHFFAERFVPRKPWRLFIGGVAVVVLWQLVGSSDFLGLGVPMIVRAFNEPALPTGTFAIKLLFTAITVGTGFIGGEVTPLFFIGATLGSALSVPLGLPVELAAAVGLAAMFACASNTPLALSVMAIELVGIGVFPHVLLVCGLAYLMSGHRSIYAAQRLTRTKWGRRLSAPTRIGDVK